MKVTFTDWDAELEKVKQRIFLMIEVMVYCRTDLRTQFDEYFKREVILYGGIKAKELERELVSDRMTAMGLSMQHMVTDGDLIKDITKDAKIIYADNEGNPIAEQDREGNIRKYPLTPEECHPKEVDVPEEDKLGTEGTTFKIKMDKDWKPFKLE